jgi:Flp pilus assembly protein CpaB
MKGSRNWAIGIFGVGLIAFSLHPVTASTAAAVNASAPVVVAARAIAQGSVMTANDLRVDFEPQPPAGVFARPSSVIGRTAAVNIRVGRVIDDAVIATAPVSANESVAIHLDSRFAGTVAPGDVVEVVGVDASSSTAVVVAGNVSVEGVASTSNGVDVIASCAPSCVLAVAGAELQSHPLALVRVSGG